VIIFLGIFFVTLSLACGFLVYRIHESIPGATDIPLIARCELIYFDIRLQPVNTLMLACPRMDYIRLWPLPIKQPWFEDWWDDRPDILIYGLL
jgi:hypothetical protein